MMSRVARVIVYLSIGLLPVKIYAQESIADERTDTILIIGNSADTKTIAGSAHVITEEDLETFEYSDVNRVLRQVPGVYVREEEGYGLRPNIGIRGTGSERSSRITLMEDGVLIAPAPYAAPSAYYFPTTGRMAGIEVLKGPAAIKYGPNTVGGAVNLISTPIPNDMSGQLLLEGSTDSTYRGHAYYGGSEKYFGWLVETHQYYSDGFKDIDSSNGHTGFAKEDYKIKLRVNSDPGQIFYQQLDLTLGYAKEISEQSYLGLTDPDFADDPYRQYAASQLDEFDGEHNQIVLRYLVEFNEHVDITATAYYNDFKRNWFKTEGFDPDGSVNAQDFKRTSWANVIDEINRGSDNAAFYQSVLDGADTLPGSIQVRANNREYYSRGIDLVTGLHFLTGSAQHDVSIGLRYHEDEEDRLQRNSTYHQENGRLVLDDRGEQGNAGDRVERAQAIAAYVHDEIQLGHWIFSPGLRYENIEKSRLNTDRNNRVEVWLPGMGLVYQITDEWSFLAGVHKGFTPASSSSDTEEEESINYELGVRYRSDNLFAEVIGFYNDYDNLLGTCTASTGSNCEVGDVFEGNGVKVIGLETSVGYDMHLGSGFAMPLRFNYTYTDAAFEKSFDSDFFGDVEEGDRLPYTAEHQFQASIGLEHNPQEQLGWGVYLNASYVDEMCTMASCDEFQQTDDSFVIDLVGHFRLTKRAEIYVGIGNLTDQDDIVARQPYGARVNKLRSAMVGVRIDL